jgi:hypothetical protein
MFPTRGTTMNSRSSFLRFTPNERRVNGVYWQHQGVHVSRPILVPRPTTFALLDSSRREAERHASLPNTRCPLMVSPVAAARGAERLVLARSVTGRLGVFSHLAVDEVAHGPGLPGGWVGGCPLEQGCRAGGRAGDDAPAGCDQKLREKTSAWFSVTPVLVVTTLRLSPQVAKRRVPLEATWL